MKKFLAFFLFALCYSYSYCQVTYPCGVYFNSTYNNALYGAWTKCYPTGDFTMAAWVQLRDDTWGRTEMDIFHREDISGNSIDRLNLYIAVDGQFKFRTNVNRDGGSVLDSLSSGIKPDPFKWYHVAVSFTAKGTCNLFVNGNTVATKDFGGPRTIAYPYIDFLAVGQRYNPATFGYQIKTYRGFMDEVAFAEKALSQSQIRTLANGLQKGNAFLQENLVVSYDKEDSYPGVVNSGIGGGQVGLVGQLRYCEYKPPVAQAGPDQTITLPTNKATLSGNAIAGTAEIVSGVWSKISGPAGGDISDPFNENPLVSNLQEGVYTFRLTITDKNGYKGTDDVIITVKEAFKVQLLDPRSQSTTVIDQSASKNGFLNKDLTLTYYKRLDERIGGCADGVTKLIVVIDTDNKVKLELSKGDGLVSSLEKQGESDRKISVEIDPDPLEKKVFAIYYLPDSINTNTFNAEHRVINIKASLVATPSVSRSVPVQIEHPPVVLIHGEWGSPSDWEKNSFVQTLRAAGLKLTLANYQINRTASFKNSVSWATMVSPFLENAIGQALNELRNMNIAAAQVDVVAHAGGGLHARQLAQEFNYLNYFKGPVHKLITLGTPHLGSAFGPSFARSFDAITILKGTLDEVPLGPPYDQIRNTFTKVADIFLNSTVERAGDYHKDINPENKKGAIFTLQQANLKVHTIAGDYKDDGQTAFDYWNNIIRDFNLYYYRFKDLNEEFNKEGNDVFVPISSALGNIVNSNHFTVFANTVNSKFAANKANVKFLTGSNAVIEQVKYLLLSSYSKDFAKYLPAPSAAGPPDPSNRMGMKQTLLQQANLLPNIPDSSYIEFDPASVNKTFNLDNQTAYQIKVNFKNGAKIKDAFILMEDGAMFKPVDTTNSKYYSFTIEIPKNTIQNKLRVSVLGFSDSAKIYSDTVSLALHNSIQLDSLVFYPKTVKIDSAIRAANVSIAGYVTTVNGTEVVSLNNLLNQKANTSSSIFKIDNAGSIVGKKPGIDSLLVEAGDISKFLKIEVDSGFANYTFLTDTIHFAPITNAKYAGYPIALEADNLSTEKINYQVVSGPIRIKNNLLYCVGIGEAQVKAVSNGNVFFSSAKPVTQKFSVGKGEQAIAFDSLADVTGINTSIVLHAKASSQLNVSFQVVSGNASVSNDTLTIIGLGDIVVRAVQNGNNLFSAAPPVERKFNVSSNTVFVFIGKGNWSNASNWANNKIPPATLPKGFEIIIEPLANEECILDANQKIEAGAKLTVKSNARLRVTGNLTNAKHHIGEVYQGGIVFYLDNNDHGLVCSPEDVGAYPWDLTVFDPQNYQNYNPPTVGVTGTGYSTGSSNTAQIVNLLGTGNYAASKCKSYSGGGYNDWYLPSKDELNLMYTNLKAAGLVNFSTGYGSYYWSSSEVDKNDAWTQKFNDGSQANFVWKNNLGNVRAIRSF